MPTEATFRFSTYLTLALACAALGYAQAPMLPEVPVLAALAVVTLGALYFLEGRVALLSIPAANRLGAVVITLFVLWAAYRIKREVDTGELAGMGWNMLLVAMIGPFVILLMAAKVARAEKHAGDYWALHGTALAGVVLAAAFAEEPLCFALVGLYLVAGVWSLTLFHLGRAAGSVLPIPDPKAPLTRATATSGEPLGTRTGIGVALVWAALAGAVAVPVYLLTPRSTAAKADFGKPRVEIGYGADQMVDLNRTGELKANNETAFELTASYPDGSPKLDLNPEQRWRGATRTRYARGEWKPEEGRFPNLTRTARHAPNWTPPNLGPGQFAITFTVPAKLPTMFLAEPVMWRADQSVPVATLTDAGPRGWMPNPDGSFYGDLSLRVPGQPAVYVQTVGAGPDPNLGPGFQLTSALLDDSLSLLRSNPIEPVKEYADKLLTDLIESGNLPVEWRDSAKLRDPKSRLPRAEHHDRIARAFEAHLATTPTLRYTLNLKREKPGVDPIVDFLFHAKAGHCERFATALVLMLRSQGIPAVFILGFKGCEHVADGRYVVKQEHAHAWVEALVSVPVPEADRLPGEPPRRFHWRTLDPTPAGADASEENQNWWQKANAWVGSRFQQYVVNYTPEQRRKELAAFADRAGRRDTLLVLAVVAGLMLAVRTALRRRARRRAEPPPPDGPTRWFEELVAVLAAHGIAAGPGETPLEFAVGAAAALRERPGCAAVAEVPIAWAEAYYQDRFGGVPPSPARLAELHTALGALRLALASRV